MVMPKTSRRPLVGSWHQWHAQKCILLNSPSSAKELMPCLERYSLTTRVEGKSRQGGPKSQGRQSRLLYALPGTEVVRDLASISWLASHADLQTMITPPSPKCWYTSQCNKPHWLIATLSYLSIPLGMFLALHQLLRSTTGTNLPSK